MLGWKFGTLFELEDSSSLPSLLFGGIGSVVLAIGSFDVMMDWETRKSQESAQREVTSAYHLEQGAEYGSQV